MNAPEPASSCPITWNPHIISLDRFAVFAGYLADLYSDVAVPYVMSASWRFDRANEPPGSPTVRAIRMNSPLIAELLSPVNEAGVLALGVVGYILRHPETLGGWVGRVRKAWYESRMQAVEARQAYDRVAHLPDQQEYLRGLAPITAEGQPIERFISVADITGYPQPRPNTVSESRPDRVDGPPQSEIGGIDGPDKWLGGPGRGFG